MEMGTYTPLAAYAVAVLGSVLGLLSAERARHANRTTRNWWIGVAAVSIGGLGIWGMHFTAMLGTWMGANVSYDIPITLLSMLVAIVVVAAGLFLVRRYGIDGDTRFWPLAAGGLVTGLGVAAMHYTGMAAIVINADVSYNIGLVALSVIIAVVASTVALWFTRKVSGFAAVIGAALVMGVAVTGMHYTGMYAMNMTHDHSASIVVGNSEELITSLIIGGAGVSVLIIFLLTLTSADEDREEAELLDRVMRRTSQG